MKKKILIFALCVTALTGGPHAFAMQRSAASGSRDKPDSEAPAAASSAAPAIPEQQTFFRTILTRIEPIWRSNAPDKKQQQTACRDELLQIANNSFYPSEQMGALEKLWTSEDPESHAASWNILYTGVWHHTTDPRHLSFFQFLNSQPLQTFRLEEIETFETALLKQLFLSQPPTQLLYWEKVIRLCKSPDVTMKGLARNRVKHWAEEYLCKDTGESIDVITSRLRTLLGNPEHGLTVETLKGLARKNYMICVEVIRACRRSTIPEEVALGRELLQQEPTDQENKLRIVKIFLRNSADEAEQQRARDLLQEVIEDQSTPEPYWDIAVNTLLQTKDPHSEDYQLTMRLLRPRLEDLTHPQNVLAMRALWSSPNPLRDRNVIKQWLKNFIRASDRPGDEDASAALWRADPKAQRIIRTFLRNMAIDKPESDPSREKTRKLLEAGGDQEFLQVLKDFEELDRMFPPFPSFTAAAAAAASSEEGSIPQSKLVDLLRRDSELDIPLTPGYLQEWWESQGTETRIQRLPLIVQQFIANREKTGSLRGNLGCILYLTDDSYTSGFAEDQNLLRMLEESLFRIIGDPQEDTSLRLFLLTMFQANHHQYPLCGSMIVDTTLTHILTSDSEPDRLKASALNLIIKAIDREDERFHLVFEPECWRILNNPMTPLTFTKKEAILTLWRNQQTHPRLLESYIPEFLLDEREELVGRVALIHELGSEPDFAPLLIILHHQARERKLERLAEELQVVAEVSLRASRTPSAGASSGAAAPTTAAAAASTGARSNPRTTRMSRNKRNTRPNDTSPPRADLRDTDPEEYQRLIAELEEDSKQTSPDKPPKGKKNRDSQKTSPVKPPKEEKKRNRKEKLALPSAAGSSDAPPIAESEKTTQTVTAPVQSQPVEPAQVRPPAERMDVDAESECSSSSSAADSPRLQPAEPVRLSPIVQAQVPEGPVAIAGGGEASGSQEAVAGPAGQGSSSSQAEQPGSDKKDLPWWELL